jgi:hypothetical protein
MFLHDEMIAILSYCYIEVEVELYPSLCSNKSIMFD